MVGLAINNALFFKVRLSIALFYPGDGILKKMEWKLQNETRLYPKINDDLWILKKPMNFKVSIADGE